MRSIFLEKSYTKCGEEASPRPFFFLKKKIKIKHISKSTVWNVIQFAIFLCPSGGLPNLFKKKCLSFAFNLYKASFEKQKKRPGSSLFASFSLWFLKKNIFHVVFYYLSKFHWLIAFTSSDIAKYMLFATCYTYLLSNLMS